MVKVCAYVGQEEVVLVCKEKQQRIFQFGHALVYTTPENSACLLRLAQSREGTGKGLTQFVQPEDELVWVIESLQETIEFRTVGCMMMAPFSDKSVVNAYERYDQGFCPVRNVWEAVRKDVKEEDYYQFGFAYRGRTGVLYHPDVEFVHKTCVPAVYRSSWLCSAQKKKEYLAKVYAVLLNRVRAGITVEEVLLQGVL